MKGFRVESQRLGVAQTETAAHQVSVTILDTPRSCIASNAMGGGSTITQHAPIYVPGPEASWSNLFRSLGCCSREPDIGLVLASLLLGFLVQELKHFGS